MFAKKPCLALIIAPTILALIIAIGNSAKIEAGSAKTQLQGSWRVQVTIKSSNPLPYSPYEALVTYMPDGSLVETKYYLSNSVSTGHGTWTFESRGIFNLTFNRLVRDSNGNVYATEKVLEKITIIDPNTYTSVRKASYIGLDGRFILSSGEETSTATRILVEALE